MSDQREAFEVWLCREWQNPHLMVEKNSAGTYVQPQTRAAWAGYQAALAKPQAQQAKACHDSDCSVNNAPALPVGPCDCGFEAQQAAAVPAGQPVWLLVREDDESDCIMFYTEKPSDTNFKDRFKLKEYTLVPRDAAPPPPVLPLSDEHIDKIREALVEKMLATVMLVGDDAWDNSLARAIERAHGITEPGAGGESTT